MLKCASLCKEASQSVSNCRSAVTHTFPHYTPKTATIDSKVIEHTDSIYFSLGGCRWTWNSWWTQLITCKICSTVTVHPVNKTQTLSGLQNGSNNCLVQNLFTFANPAALDVEISQYFTMRFGRSNTLDTCVRHTRLT